MLHKRFSKKNSCYRWTPLVLSLPSTSQLESNGGGAGLPGRADPSAPTLQMRLPMLTLLEPLQTGPARSVQHFC